MTHVRKAVRDVCKFLKREDVRLETAVAPLDCRALLRMPPTCARTDDIDDDRLARDARLPLQAGHFGAAHEFGRPEG